MLEEAQSYSGKAVAYNGKDPLYLFHAGMIAYGLGQRDNARTLLERSFANFPTFAPPLQQEARETLSTLAG
jgi:Tfp pilus assembly protein PilF